MALNENEKDLIRQMLAFPFKERLKQFSKISDEKAKEEVEKWKTLRKESLMKAIRKLEDELEALDK